MHSLVARWRVHASADTVWDVLHNVASLPRWWPGLVDHVAEVDGGAPDDTGRLVNLQLHALLYGTLRTTGRVTSSLPPQRLVVELHGDLDGTLVCTLDPDGDYTVLSWELTAAVDRELARSSMGVAKRLLAATWRQAMTSGERSLALELQRREASPEGRAAIPPPPQPWFTSTLPLLLGAAGTLSAVAGAVVLVLRRRPPTD